MNLRIYQLLALVALAASSLLFYCGGCGGAQSPNGPHWTDCESAAVIELAACTAAASHQTTAQTAACVVGSLAHAVDCHARQSTPPPVDAGAGSGTTTAMTQTINERIEQTVDITGIDQGEINVLRIIGTQSGATAYPGDVFGLVARVDVNDACEGSHSQRVGAAAFETVVRGGQGHERNVIGVEASAEGGTYNTAFLAMQGDIAALNGDIYTNSGNVQAPGGMVAGHTVMASDRLGIRSESGNRWAYVLTIDGPPTADTAVAPRGSLALDCTTPALWLSDGDTWRCVTPAPGV